MKPTIILLACALPLCAQAQNRPQYRQTVEVIDGDTIRIGDQDIRLWGIDAPEYNQSCRDEQQAGRIARAFLFHLIDSKPLRCKYKERDRYGRPVMICLNHEGTDLGRAMVDAGWAWAYTHYTIDYVENEVLARRKKLGVHGMVCELPWVWRRQNGQGGAPTPLPKPRQ